MVLGAAGGPRPNSEEALRARAAAGGLVPLAIAVVALARTILAFLAQGVTAVVLALQGVPRPYLAAADFMTVHATLVDLGSLALLVVVLRWEGLRLRDLFDSGPPVGWGRSLVEALVVLVGLGVVGVAGASATSMLVYGTPLLPPPVGSLPLWAGLYSTLVFPVIWGFTEEATYNGYAAPRARALGRPELLALVVFGWALQHVGLPFRPDTAYLVGRFVPALGVAIAAVAVYLRTRRLWPLALAHWWIDVFTGTLTLM